MLAMRSRIGQRWKNNNSKSIIRRRNLFCNAHLGFQRENTKTRALRVQSVGPGRLESNPSALAEILQQPARYNLRGGLK